MERPRNRPSREPDPNTTYPFLSLRVKCLRETREHDSGEEGQLYPIEVVDSISPYLTHTSFLPLHKITPFCQKKVTGFCKQNCQFIPCVEIAGTELQFCHPLISKAAEDMIRPTKSA